MIKYWENQYMSSTPKEKLYTGIFLIVISPFIFLGLPPYLAPIMCDPQNHEWFHCTTVTFCVSIPAAIVALIWGISLIATRNMD